MAVSKLDEMDKVLRVEGQKNGIQFPKEAPAKNVFGPKVGSLTFKGIFI